MRPSTIQLQPREKRVVIGGALAATLLLAYLLWPSGGDDSQVELVSADQRKGVNAPAPQPLPVVQVAPPSPAPIAAAPTGVVPQGLVLHGVMAGGAIFGFGDGSQRYVAIGRDVVPGVRLQAVQLHHAVLASGSANFRLGFNGPPTALTPPTAPAVSAPPAVVGPPATPAPPAPPSPVQPGR